LRELSYLIPLVAFVALYAFLAQRAKRRAAQGRGPEPRPFWPDQAVWLALIIACAAVAVIVGVLD